ncbi:hypothetical protein C7S16_6662 [Burkholderia thailandensis]|uniref:Uncharacterized protein n=1 Tax=Burkholderia thailandensis TaxID=57975 RepID=A0AAW9CJI9_BURTH|nr:hypothetical protein [Burkholderia thailandensis]MDW9250754.1 hypothetical protein [Burkholderia thailandensis]
MCGFSRPPFNSITKNNKTQNHQDDLLKQLIPFYFPGKKQTHINFMDCITYREITY